MISSLREVSIVYLHIWDLALHIWKCFCINAVGMCCVCLVLVVPTQGKFNDCLIQWALSDNVHFLLVVVVR